MTLMTLPTGFDFEAEDWTITVPAQVNRSIFTSRRKVIGLPGAETWAARVSVEALTTEVDERQWRRFLLSLRGQQNYFRIPANCQNPPQATAVVSAGATDGYTLPLATLPVSQTILEAGEFMTVPLPSGHHRLVCLMQDLVSNGTGAATAVFEPNLGEVPDFAATVVLDQPYSPMSLKAPTNGWSRANGLTQIVLDAEEAL